MINHNPSDHLSQMLLEEPLLDQYQNNWPLVYYYDCYTFNRNKKSKALAAAAAVKARNNRHVTNSNITLRTITNQ